MGTKRDGEFPVDGDIVLGPEGSRWRFFGEEKAWTQLDEPGPSQAELVELDELRGRTEELVSNVEGNVAELQGNVRQLGRAHRMWAPSFAKCPIVRSGPPRLDTSVDQAVELVLRAHLTDQLALVCDGMVPGLRDMVLSQLRSVLDQVEFSQVERRVAEAEALADQLAPGSTPDDVRAARDELYQLASELPQDSKAKATIAVLLDPHAKLDDDSVRPDGATTERGIEDAPDVLGRQLLLEGVALELAKRMYIAAVQVANERLKNEANERQRAKPRR
jgi:hypothetical protein